MTFRELLPAAIVLGWALRRPQDLKYIWRKTTDWNAVRRSMGYEPTADRPVTAVPVQKQRYFLGFWPLRTNWDKERKRLGY